MAGKKRHATAEIAAKLLDADALAKNGQPQAKIAKALGISVMTLHRWRKSESGRRQAYRTSAVSRPGHRRTVTFSSREFVAHCPTSNRKRPSKKARNRSPSGKDEVGRRSAKAPSHSQEQSCKDHRRCRLQFTETSQQIKARCTDTLTEQPRWLRFSGCRLTPAARLPRN